MPYFISDQSVKLWDEGSTSDAFRFLLGSKRRELLGTLSARYYCLEGISELSYLFLLCLIHDVLTKKYMRSLILRICKHRNIMFDTRFPKLRLQTVRHSGLQS
jgi:hypothetical protein